MKTTILVLAALLALPVQGEEKPQPQKTPPAEDTEKRLEAARERLEQAAREVAELSMELGAPVLDRFASFGPSRRSIIGVQLDRESGGDGARIEDVSPGGPAAAAGLRRGDVIVAVDGMELKGGDAAVRELTRRLREIEPDTKVKLRYLRDGKPHEAQVVTRGVMYGPAVRALQRFPEMPVMPAIPVAPGEHFEFMHGLRGELSGMELATLTPKLGRYFGTDQGVLVLRAPESDTFRLEDGDVILSVDGREPRSGSHATRILRSYQPGEKLRLRVMRQKKALDFDVTLPDEERRRAARVAEERT